MGPKARPRPGHGPDRRRPVDGRRHPAPVDDAHGRRSRGASHRNLHLGPQRKWCGPEGSGIGRESCDRGQGDIARNRNAAKSVRCTPPAAGSPGPGTTVSTPTTTVMASSTIWVGAEAEAQRRRDPDRGDRQGRDGEADAGHRRPQREVERGLHALAAGGVGRGEGLGQQHQQRDDHTDERHGQADREDALLDGRRLDLRQPDHRHQRQQQEAERDRPRAGRRVGVLVLGERLALVDDRRKKSRWRTVWVTTNAR